MGIENWIRALSGLRVKPRHILAFRKHNNLKKLENLFRVNLEFRQRKTDLAGFPFILVVDPTNICNLRCPLCPTGAKEYGRPPGRMKFDEFAKIIDDIGDRLYEVGLFNFGEPLLNREVFSMADYAHRRGIFACLSTNLTILSEHDAKALIQSKLDYLIVSIDGLTPQTYSKYRVGGDFDSVIDNLRKIIELKRNLHSPTPIIEWQFLVFRHNSHEAHKVKEFAKTIGVDRVFVGNALLSVDNQPSSDAWQWVLEGEERKKYHHESYGKGKACHFLWHTLTINHDGGVSPCCLAYHKEGDFANYFTEGCSFQEIWNNARFRAARSIFRNNAYSADEDIICNRCYVAREFLEARQKNGEPPK